MSVLDPQVIMESQITLNQTDWQQVRNHLEHKKQQLYSQIGNYPSPIAGCDQQFNYLLEQQKLVIQELARLTAAEDAQKSLEDFIRTSTFFRELE